MIHKFTAIETCGHDCIRQHPLYHFAVQLVHARIIVDDHNVWLFPRDMRFHKHQRVAQLIALKRLLHDGECVSPVCTVIDKERDVGQHGMCLDAFDDGTLFVKRLRGIPHQCQRGHPWQQRFERSDRWDMHHGCTAPLCHILDCDRHRSGITEYHNCCRQIRAVRRSNLAIEPPHRQIDMEGTATAWFALDRQHATMQRHQTPRDCQTQPDSTVAGVCVRERHKRFEYGLLFCWGNTQTGVLYPDVHIGRFGLCP